MRSLVITDLDNTLYDWVTYFARSFRAMIGPLVSILHVSEDRLLDEFRDLNRSLGTVEHPFSLFELPTVRRKFGPAPAPALRRELDPALHAFNAERQASLRLYPDVEETLAAFASAGIIVVGHTEASMANAYYRLTRLGVANRLKRLYVLESPRVDHPDPARLEELRPPAELTVEVPRTERKPNPALLLDICAREGVAPSEALYVGDSIVRDVAMAQRAGIAAAWARYGTGYTAEDWATIVRVTHWTADDVAADARARADAKDVKPDFTLAGFSDLRAIVGLARIAQA